MSMTLSNSSRPWIDSYGDGVRVVAPFSRSAAIGYRVLLIKVDLPEPDTPVIQVNRPKGISRVTLFRLLPVAPTRRSILSESGAVRCSGMAIIRAPERYSPVSEPGVGIAHV